MEHMWGYNGPMPWYGMMFGMIAFFAIAVVVILLMMRACGMGPLSRGQYPHSPGAPDQRALDILSARFARGEIDQAEYEEKRRMISQP